MLHLRRGLVEKHKLGVGKNLIGKVGFVLVNPPYDVRRNRNNVNAAYDVFSSKHLQKIVKIMGDNKRPRIPGHVVCAALQFAFWYNVQALG